jgi:hypothetical protein
MSRRPLSLILCLDLLLLASSSPTTAATDPPAASTAVVADAVEAAFRAGASRAEVDRLLAERFGWIAVGAAPGSRRIGPNESENQDVELSTPSVYYNTQQGRYEAFAWFHWQMCGLWKCWLQDYFGQDKIGEYDGFGLSIGRLVTRVTQSMYVYTEHGESTTYRNPWDADDSGATFRNQDKMLCGPASCYNWDHGLIVYSFHLRRTCPKGNYPINTKIGHTWSSTGVTDITVSLTGISITFDEVPHRWQAVNPTQRNWYPCGS